MAKFQKIMEQAGQLSMIWNTGGKNKRAQTAEFTTGIILNEQMN